MKNHQLFIPRKDKKDADYGIDMRAIENVVNNLPTGGGVTEITIGTTGSHGKQILISPTPVGTGHVILSIPTTLDITILKASQIQPSGGSTSITVTGNTITIKGATKLYLAGIIEMLRTATGITGQLATACTFSKTLSHASFVATLAYDTWRTFTVHRTAAGAFSANIQVGPTSQYAAGVDIGATGPSFQIVGAAYIPGGAAVATALSNATFGIGNIIAAG